MIKAVIFDIGKVLLQFDFNIAIEKLRPLCRVEGERVLAPIEEIKVAYEAGRLPREAFLQQAFELLGFTGTERDFVSAWEEIFEVNTPMVEVVQGLKGRLPLYLLSNTSDIHVDYMLEKYPFFALFDDAVYSYRVCCAKPEPEIFHLAARQFGVDPAETLFIDDLPANIATARQLGFQAFQYDLACHAALLTELERLGVAKQLKV